MSIKKGFHSWVFNFRGAELSGKSGDSGPRGMVFYKNRGYIFMDLYEFMLRSALDNEFRVGGVYKPRGKTRGEGGCSDDHNT